MLAACRLQCLAAASKLEESVLLTDAVLTWLAALALLLFSESIPGEAVVRCITETGLHSSDGPARIKPRTMWPTTCAQASVALRRPIRMFPPGVTLLAARGVPFDVCDGVAMVTIQSTLSL
jgi:hypothetical protein